MSVDAIYKGRRARVINETSEDMNVGPRLDYGDGLLFRVSWGDPALEVEPGDAAWEAAAPMSTTPLADPPTDGWVQLKRREPAEAARSQELTEDQFYELFDNVPNPKDQGLYWEHAEVIAADIPTERVWSAMDGDDGSMGLAPGFHVVNVFAYVVSVRPWTDEGIFVIFDSNDEEDDR